MLAPRRRIRLVLLDAFDTLITPRQPIHLQYAEEAQRAGLVGLTAADVRRGFKSSFPALTARYPLYGARETPPMTADHWWTLLIEQTMLAAGAKEADIASALPALAPRLLTRFASNEGYAAFPDAHAALESLKAMGVKTAVLSNADDRILRVLDALELTPLLSSPPTLSHLTNLAKPDRQIFELACARAGVEADEALMVGDELEADYHGARRAGLRALLLRRTDQTPSDGAVRSPTEDLTVDSFDAAGGLTRVETVGDLAGVAERVKQWNEAPLFATGAVAQ